MGGELVNEVTFAIPSDLVQRFVQSAPNGQLPPIRQAAPVAPAASIASSSQPASVMTVNNPFGTALRAAPGSDARILANVGCGSVVRVLDSGAGG